MLEPLTREAYEALAKDDSYYRGRWPYYEAALRLVDLVVDYSVPSRVLEIGPWRCPLLAGADTLDKRNAPGVSAPTYRLDAASTPWPIPDQRYDLVIGLQVWEHLEGRQRQAWDEVRRVARAAVLSFPLEWDNPRDATHYNITLDRIARWTRKVPSDRAELVGHNTRHPRLVCLWRFG